ncbi:MAG: hypothetical protein OJF62_000166 [Pseudolabrys sp.]|nr:hypothetical protein [Pseudolabrys sp.]
MLAASLAAQTPLHAADLGAGIGVPAGAVVAEDGVVRAAPLVVFDFQPGITQREYWLTPWDGRHYFPSGGKLPVLGRKEVLRPKPASTNLDYHRSWSTFPIDTIQQPPVVFAPTYMNGGGVAPPVEAPSK